MDCIFSWVAHIRRAKQIPQKRGSERVENLELKIDVVNEFMAKVTDII